MFLSPPQRIVLIREISSGLAKEEWSIIDLCLKQFSLPWSDQWAGNKVDYVIQMISDASDEILIQLGEHIGFHFEEAKPPSISPPFWRKGMFRLFVTHLAKHRKFAGQLQEECLKFGISCFVAHNDIEPTLEWQNEIETALATSDALVALLHPDFHLSNWTDQEIGFAMGRGAPVFTIQLGQDPYGFIGRFQAFNGNGKALAALSQELFDTLRKNKQTQRRMSEVLVGLFEESNSFAEAKTRIGYLEELDVWQQNFVTRIKAATEGNSQIHHSWGVPQRVDALAEKWSGS